MNSLQGKRLLIIGGAFQHVKLVETAKSLGVITYVTDYLQPEQAPAKQIADHYYMYNITQVDEIVQLCRQEHIDGILSTSLDACQKPYQVLCERLGLPCFGNEEQFRILTGKQDFKAFCRKCGVDVIPEYTEADFSSAALCARRVQFPILIKPGESRGSRGQSICADYEQALAGIAFARQESADGQVVIEKYMGQNNDFSMTVLVLNGKAYPLRTVDRILGSYEDQLDKLAVGSVSPSAFTDLYLSNVHEKIANFCRRLGLYNAPMFMQGFVDGDTVRFYDPGLRLPGGEYERMFRAVWGIDPIAPLVEFALTGQVTDPFGDIEDAVKLRGKVAGQVLPTLRPGVIGRIDGLEQIKAHPQVISVFPRFVVGDTIAQTRNVNQRFCEIDLVCEDHAELADLMDWVYDTLKIVDEHGESMIVSRVDTAAVRSRHGA